MDRLKLNSNQLKLIAVVLMTLDHCAVVFLPVGTGFYLIRAFGRTVAPLMCYMIAEGYYHTSDLKKYMLRLFFVAAAAHIPYCLCFGYRLTEATDVLFSLLFGLIALAVSRYDGLNRPAKLLIVLICCLAAYTADWNYIAVLWVLGFGAFRDDRKKQLAAFLAVSALYFAQGLLLGRLLWYRFGVLLTLPLLLLYSGGRGRRSKWIKWGFYIYYPAHLLIIFLIAKGLNIYV